MADIRATSFPRQLGAERNQVLRNTYWLLGLSLIPTAIGALVGMQFSWSFLQTNPILFALGFLGVFYGMIFAIEKNRNSSVGVFLLLGFTFLMGVMLAPLLKVALGLSNGGQLVAFAAGGTGVAFFGLSAVASTTKKDLGFLGNFLAVGVLIAIVAVIANIFLASPVLHLTLCAVIMMLSAGLILWQLNAIVRGGETNYVSATLTLYISVYNLFTTMLQLLMAFAGNRD
jgi:FtsH-binding integral membrane protein